MKFKWFYKTFTTIIISIGLFFTTAFASSGAEETVTPAVIPTETTVEQATEPLTPDGNLTLVDDISKSGKQFITVVTKTGNYFYLIIDRDDEGNETVHFLNQVDEADLMKLMDEEELEQFIPDEEVEPEPIPVSEPEPKSIEEPQEPEKEVNTIPIIMLILLLIGGITAFVFLKFKGKKQAEQVKPDPDADYIEDEEYDFPEDDEYEEDNEPVN